MTYFYTLAELTALGVADLSLTYRSLAADTASLRVPLGAQMSSPVPWTAGDRICICDERVAGSPRLFSGQVKSLHTTLSGTDYALHVELANDVDVLERTTFAYIDDNGKVCYAQSFYAPRELGDSPYGERLTSSRTVCERCFEWATGGGALSCTLEVTFDSTIMGVAGTGSQSCWSLIRTALKWVPDAATAMRYAATGDTLQCLTARDMPVVRLDAATHRMLDAAGAELGRFEGIASVDLTPRPDLVPPVCAVTGRAQLVLPEGGDVRAPGAFIYHVRESGGAVNEAQVARAARQAALEMAPEQEVLGRAAPLNPATALGETNMREQANWAPAQLLAWYSSFGTFSLLKKLGTARLTFGNPLFEPVGVEEAYPPEDEESEAPANYETPQAWGKLYLLDKGTFPASPKASRNVSGLKWCRGRLSQYVWIQPGSTLPNGVSREQVLEFFSGTHPVVDGGRKTMTRYALLTVDGVWINRRKVVYREGDNATGGDAAAAAAIAEDAPATVAAEQAMATLTGPDAKYAIALQDFYAATRKLYYDGTIVLTGVEGNPGALLATGINVSGLLPEWEHMQTPCNAVSYDPIARRATLTLGCREGLTMDELLARQELGRVQASSRVDGATDNPLDETPDSDWTGEGGADDDEEPLDMVAPSVTASVATGATGKALNPFEVYAEGSKWMLNGGSVPKPAGWVTAEPIDITAHYKEGRRFYAKWSTAAGKVVYRYTDNTSSNS